MSLRRALVDIVLTLALFSLIAVLVSSWSVAVPIAYRIPVVVVLQGVLLLGVVSGVLAWRGQAWTRIGVVPLQGRDARRGVFAFGLCLGVNLVFVQALNSIQPDLITAHAERLGAIAQRLSEGATLAGLVALLAFVAVYEEIFARGLLLDRCRVVFRGTWIPILVSALLFGLGHLYQGWIGVSQTTLVGLILAIGVVRWGTVWPAIIAHALLDISSVLFMSGLAESGGS